MLSLFQKRSCKSSQRQSIVVCFLGNSIEFENKWSDYQTDVLSITYPTDFAINLTIGFNEDIATEFENVANIKIAKSIHGINVEMFHVMINLSN